MELPPELRNRIFTLVFEDFTAKLELDVRYRAPGVLLACRQIYGEANGLYYSNATFQLLLPRATPMKSLARRLSSLAYKYQKLIRKVALTTPTEIRRFALITDEHASYEIETRPRALAQMAEYHIANAKSFLADHRILRPTNISTSMRTPKGKPIWSETPLKTFRDLEAADPAKQ